MLHGDIAEYRPVADACQRPLLPRVAVACFFHVYGYRRLTRHTPRGVVCPAWYVQQLSASINAELLGSQEVFKQPVDGMTSPPYGPAHQLVLTVHVWYEHVS